MDGDHSCRTSVFEAICEQRHWRNEDIVTIRIVNALPHEPIRRLRFESYELSVICNDSYLTVIKALRADAIDAKVSSNACFAIVFEDVPHIIRITRNETSRSRL